MSALSREPARPRAPCGVNERAEHAAGRALSQMTLALPGPLGEIFRLLCGRRIVSGEAFPYPSGTRQWTLTKRQREILDFIGTYEDKHGYAPSLEEIAEFLTIYSLATVPNTSATSKNLFFGLIKRAYNESGRSR